MKLNPQDMVSLTAAVGPERIRVMHIHAKVCVIRGRSRTVTITSSMNLSSNPRVEQFTFLSDVAHGTEVAAEMERMWESGSQEWGAVASREAFDRLTPGRKTALEKRMAKAAAKSESPMERIRREAETTRTAMEGALQGIPRRRGE